MSRWPLTTPKLSLGPKRKEPEDSTSGSLTRVPGPTGHFRKQVQPAEAFDGSATGGAASQDVQILAGSRLVAVGAPNFAQKSADAQTGGADSAGVVASAASAPLPAAAPLAEEAAGLVRVAQLEADLLEDADEQLVDVVLHAARRLDELAVEGGRQRFATCNNRPVVKLTPVDEPTKEKLKIASTGYRLNVKNGKLQDGAGAASVA